MLNEIDPSSLTDAAGNTGDSPATSRQACLYGRIVGKMLYIGTTSAPLMMYNASNAATKLLDLQRHQLRSLASVLKRIKSHGAILHILSPPRTDVNLPPFTLDFISEGATTPVPKTNGREAHILFRRCGDIVHPFTWSARKLRRVSRSSATAEIISAANAVSNELFIRVVLEDILNKPPTADLTIDSTALQSLYTIIKEPEERYKKIDIAATREAYDHGLLNAALWCPGPKLLVDPLTKDNQRTAALLLDALHTGLHRRPTEMTINLGHPTTIRT